jgi:ferrous-iron efflux pump FieF
MDSRNRNAQLLRWATRASVVTASILVAAKIVAWLSTGSVTVLASLVDSLMDVGASLVNLMAVSYSLKPADEEHRFGHGKAEALAGLSQATFIAGSAVFLLLQAVDRLLTPAPLVNLAHGLLLMTFAIAATAILLSFQFYVIKRTGSTAIRADALHYLTDLATNGATITVLILASYGMGGVDGLFALLIGLYILYSAARVGRDAINLLMDRELPAVERQAIATTVTSTASVLGMHGLRTWRSGQLKIIQLHLELDPEITLKEAHRISAEVERRIIEIEPAADVTIHEDPLGFDETDHQNRGDLFSA